MSASDLILFFASVFFFLFLVLFAAEYEGTDPVVRKIAQAQYAPDKYASTSYMAGDPRPETMYAAFIKYHANKRTARETSDDLVPVNAVQTYN